ncbi:MAG: cytochrome P450 [Azospirillum sp.]|nr:cytochrome P450 [Azospirillum sp.]
MTQYLAIYDQATPEQQPKLVRTWLKNEPVPFMKQLRRERPIFPTANGTYLALYEDCIEALRQPAVMSVRLYKPKMGDFMLANDLTIANWRDKGIMQAMLNPNDIPRVRAMIGRQCDAALDAAEGRIEAVNRYARKVPIRMVDEYFGFPGPHDPGKPPNDDKMIEWSYANQLDAFRNYPFNDLDNPEQIFRNSRVALAEMRDWLTIYLPRKGASLQQNPGQDDVVARMLKTRFDPALGFDGAALALNVGGLLIGAVETTQQVVVQVIDQLLKRPVQFAAARRHALADEDAAFDPYVWEALRFAPISPFMFRYVEQDYTFAKGTARAHTVPAGTTVLPLTWSAMSDERYFPRPDEFNINRTGVDTFHLGYGHHDCLGRMVATVMVPEMVKRVLRRDSLSAEGAIDFQGTPYPQSWWLRFSAGG